MLEVRILSVDVRLPIAGQGIGQAIAGRFAREGARVVIAALVAERGEAAAAALQTPGGVLMDSAAGASIEEPSPIPLEPSAVCGEGVRRCPTVTSGISGAGMRE